MLLNFIENEHDYFVANELHKFECLYILYVDNYVIAFLLYCLVYMYSYIGFQYHVSFVC